ncbi:MAG: glycosyltransferase family 4 protein [Oscillospiraceae bacterium]|nr:glycosyltransferase family 4 protein [Oscillospiraceae bacterium]MCI9166868.1 glycosyltransferase family 4 protein [Dorea sp.]
MNILYIDHYAGSLTMGMEFRPYYFTREWVKLGHKVSIIAGDYSHLRKKNPNVERDFQHEKVDRVDYYWIKTGKYKGNGIKRALTMVRFVTKIWMRAKWVAETFKPDVIICSSTYPIDTFAGQHIKKYCNNGILVHEIHDMWPSTLTEIGGMSEKNPFVLLMQAGENSAYRYSDAIVSVLPYTEKYMRKHGLKGKFVYINNGIVLDDWKRKEGLPSEHEQVLQGLKGHGKFIVGYFGGHALSNNLSVLLDVAEDLKENNRICFVLVGDGIEKPILQEISLKKELKNVIFLPPVSKYAIPELTRYFDCSYISASNSPLYRFGIAMNKIFDSMMAAKPLVFAVNAPNNFAEMYQCGISAEAGNVDSIKNAIERLENMSEAERTKMGQNGHKAVLENYEYGGMAKRFLAAMQN